MTNTRIAMQRRLPLIGLVALAFVSVTVSAASATAIRDSRGAQNGDWIAYSTVPGDSLWRRGGPGYLTGSDVFVVRHGREPILVAGRGDGRPGTSVQRSRPTEPCWRSAPSLRQGLSVSVVRVTRSGVSAARGVHLKVGGTSMRRALSGPPTAHGWHILRGGKVVVRGLDGSSARAGVGDPVMPDFGGRHTGSIMSPGRNLVAASCGRCLRRGRRAA